MKLTLLFAIATSTSSFVGMTTGQTLAPTTSKMPTTSPTNSTMAPSVMTAPTSGPTVTPTIAPTTSAPTLSPTGQPNVSPTSGPTSGPSANVESTSGPTTSPTGQPNVESTSSPTIGSTMSPTNGPTSAPPTSTPTITKTSEPTPFPTTNPTASAFPSSLPTASAPPSTSFMPTMPQECSAHPACSGLIDDCCPNGDTFLYCCFESADKEVGGKYSKDMTLIGGPDSNNDQAEYFISTSTYFFDATAPDGTPNIISYVRDPMEVYDMVYFKTSSIQNANDYVSGTKKLYLDIFATDVTPPCTQIIVQLDNIGIAQPDNYPIGRHSRYVALTTKQNEWETLEFDFLDRPDQILGDDQIDSIAMFFSPGLKGRADPYYFQNFDSTSQKGCTDDCKDPAPKSCVALYDGEQAGTGACSDGIDNDEDGLIDCEDAECTLDAACAEQVQTAYASATRQVRSAGDGGAGLTGPSSGSPSRPAGSSATMAVLAAGTAILSMMAMLL